MDISSLKTFLFWCLVVNYIILFVWFAAFAFAHGWMYRMHSRWFRIAEERFDAIHYAGMAIYKIGILLFNLAPLVALVMMTKHGS
ncbi:MAG TPA: hypothetical protein VKB34_01980 [Povalibacter sp.]|nr:hypothetical protein [Povalibacter sp.]